MILLIDLGNSRLKWAKYENKDLVTGEALSHVDINISFEELCDNLWNNLDKPTRVLCSNVAGKILGLRLSAWVREKWQLELSFCTSMSNMLGLNNGYLDYQKFGVDRWLSMLWAWQANQKSVCVIDCGTALTVDAVNSQGQHLGGLIVPGLNLMRESLLANTKEINLAIDFKNDGRKDGKKFSNLSNQLLATDTYHAVLGGILYTTAAFINNLIEDLQQDLDGETYKIYLTGGNAPQLLNLLNHEINYFPNLVLLGMQCLVENGY